MQNSELGLVIIVILVVIAIWVWSRCQLNCDVDERYVGIGQVRPSYVVGDATRDGHHHVDQDDDDEVTLKGLKWPEYKHCPQGCHYDSCTCKCEATHPYAHLGYPVNTVKASIPGSTLASYGVGTFDPYDVKTDVVIY